MSTRVIDQNVSHHLGADGEEVSAILPWQSLLTDELEVRLIHERGCLQRVAGAFVVHLALSDTPEFRVYEWKEFIERGAVAFTPIGKQLSDFLRRHVGHRAKFCHKEAQKAQNRVWPLWFSFVAIGGEWRLSHKLNGG